MMEGVTSHVKYPASSFLIWFVSWIWRRKAFLLTIILLALLLVVCLEYKVTKGVVNISFSRQDSIAKAESGEGNSQRLRMVQFVGDESLATRDSVVDVMGKNNGADFVKIVDDCFQNKWNGDSSYSQNIKVPYIPKHRVVHLDFKGAPPKIEFLKKCFAFIKELGATGVLLEWEDMFPWENKLSSLAAWNAFTKEEVKEIISSARGQNLEVIPLIQTFGHLEFALKNHEFLHLREVPESPQALCPSLNASIDFVHDMINQIMQVHGNIDYLHIGCDEVFNMGECSRCRKKLRDELFLSHVTSIAEYIHKQYPYVNLIIWDDMLRHLPTAVMEQFNIGKLVEPMVWVYAEDVTRFVPQSIWEKYQSIFPYAWTASAFKGAFGETYYVPNVKRHLENNINWLTLMSGEETRFSKGFRGIAITGWQRYDHFATLCETLPAAIPSLAVNLAVVSHGYVNNSLKELLYKVLRCGVASETSMSHLRDTDVRDSFLNLENDPFLWDQFSRCMFIGSQFYRMLFRWHSLQKEIDEYLTTTKTKKAWLTDYNKRRNFSSPLRLDELMLDEGRIYNNVLSMMQSISDALEGIFDKYTIAEWIEQTIYPTALELEELQRSARKLKSLRTWPRRPLPPLNDLLRMGITVLGNSTKDLN